MRSSLSVVLCGSMRHYTLMVSISHAMSGMGTRVYLPERTPLKELPSSEVVELAWRGALLHHFRKIDRSVGILVVNPDGYVGASTTLEIGYAAAMGRHIWALRKDPEPVRTVLFDQVIDDDDAERIAERLHESLAGSHHR